ncbi:MAG: phenylalanine--tRNA ligase subunit alpha [Parcubacteria group bacterium]|nr:phenylalanine--tRNA ligase subunit alpha [Parcubacteria group bacterium]
MSSDQKKRIAEIRAQALDLTDTIKTLSELGEFRVRFLGRKSELTSILRSLKDLPEEERREVGKAANTLYREIEEALDFREKSLESMPSELTLDVTRPGIRPRIGAAHPTTKILESFEEVFTSMGFEVVEGPEVETDYYNFEALNIPKGHPARDMWDTFYLESPEAIQDKAQSSELRAQGEKERLLLRTHTSPVQVRVMEQRKPPIRIIVPGRVYRHENEDATHSAMFYQVEGLLVDEGITFAHLKATLMYAFRLILGEDRIFRFRPSFFPFTEPSAEVDVRCEYCEGTGCETCRGKGWLELLGAGMVHPNVLKKVGYDPDTVSGFAFGAGPDRIAMKKYGFTDIRMLYKNDLRFLSQFI